jgi:hypothetical protein
MSTLNTRIANAGDGINQTEDPDRPAVSKVAGYHPSRPINVIDTKKAAIKNHRRSSRNRQTGFYGVSRAESGKFFAKFGSKHLGTFGRAEDAARAWDVAAKVRFGAAALQNFPVS